MKERMIMEIKIIKTTENNVELHMLNEVCDLCYDTLSKIIDYSLANFEEEIKVSDETQEKELTSYVELIKKVIEGSRTTDFVTAVKNANEAKEALNDAKKDD